MPQFDTTHFFSTCFWLILCVGATIFYYSKVVIPHLVSRLSAQEDGIEKMLKQQQQFERESSELSLLYDQKISEARLELNKQMKDLIVETDMKNQERLRLIKEEHSLHLQQFVKALNDEVNKMANTLDERAVQHVRTLSTTFEEQAMNQFLEHYKAYRVD